MDEFLKQKPMKQVIYVVEDILNKDRRMLVASVPGEGKSLVIENMLSSIIYGAPFLGYYKVTVGSCMLIDSENKRDILQHRLSMFKKGFEMDGYKMQGSLDIQPFSGLLLDDESENSWKKVRDTIVALQPSVIVLDHLHCFHFQDENQATPMKKVNRGLAKLEDICEDSSSVNLHHFNKNVGNFFRRCRGSSVIYGDSDIAIEVRTLEKVGGRLSKIGIIPQSRKEITLSPFRIRVDEGKDWMKLIYDGNYRPAEDPKIDLIEHRIYHTFLQDRDEKTVYDTVDILAGLGSLPEVRLCLQDLEDRNLMVIDRRGKGGKWYCELPPGVAKCPWCYP